MEIITMDKPTPAPIDRGLMEDVQLPYFSEFKYVFDEIDIPIFTKIEEAIEFSKYLPIAKAHEFLLAYSQGISNTIGSRFVYDFDFDTPSLKTEPSDYGDHIAECRFISKKYLAYFRVQYEIKILQKEMEAQSIPFETKYHYWRFPETEKLETLVNTLTELEIIPDTARDTARQFFSGDPIQRKMKYNQSLPHFIYLCSCLTQAGYIQTVQPNAAFKYYLSTLDYKGEPVSENTAKQYRHRFNKKGAAPNDKHATQINRILSDLAK